jgi:hypothetical protein
MSLSALRVLLPSQSDFQNIIWLKTENKTTKAAAALIEEWRWSIQLLEFLRLAGNHRRQQS